MFKWLKETDRIWLSGWFGGAFVAEFAARFHGSVKNWEIILTFCLWFLFAVILTEKKHGGI